MYPFGIDPVWMNSRNDITFYNSFKMKAAVIIGVAQMLLGIFLKGVNARHRDDKVMLLHEVVPQALLMLCLFGFMNILIIQKWLTDYTHREGGAPSIITIMIDMFLNYGVSSQQAFDLIYH